MWSVNLNLWTCIFSVLDFEPNNITAKDFYPLIEERMRSKLQNLHVNCVDRSIQQILNYVNIFLPGTIFVCSKQQWMINHRVTRKMTTTAM